jgi:hypothetical protein
MADTLFVLMNPASEEIHGGSYDQAEAQAWAQELGPGTHILTFTRNSAGKWERQGQDLRAADLAALRQEMVSDLGLSAGLLRQAILEGWTPAQAQATFQGKTKAEILGDSWNAELWTPGWADPKVRAEFGSIDRYLAYLRAVDRGQVRRFR